jgi:uncharacterized protein
MQIFTSVLKTWLFVIFFVSISCPLLASMCQNNIISVKGNHGIVDFQVEIAETPFDRKHGLMGRKKLGMQSGMLFLYKKPHKVSFWMKNTIIPLDIIFLANSGQITHIEHNAQPFTLKSISGGIDTIAVLEINGQSAIRKGIKIGDVVRHPFFSRFDNKWPCKVKD